MPSKSNESMSASTGVTNCCRRDSHSDALPSTEACKTLRDSGPVSSDGDVPLPWWYSPRRLLVRLPSSLPRVSHMPAEVEGNQTEISLLRFFCNRNANENLLSKMVSGEHLGRFFCCANASSRSVLDHGPASTDAATHRDAYEKENVDAIAGALLLCVVSGVRGYGAAVQQWRDWYKKHRPKQHIYGCG